MNVSCLPGTCSMIYISNIDWYNDFECKTKAQLERDIRTTVTSKGEGYQNKREIIYNTNANFIKRLRLWWNHGFKTQYSYKGNNGRVYVMFKKINKLK